MPFIPARSVSSDFLHALRAGFHPRPLSWWNAPVMGSGKEGQMGHLLDILLLSKYNQKENN